MASNISGRVTTEGAMVLGLVNNLLAAPFLEVAHAVNATLRLAHQPLPRRAIAPEAIVQLRSLESIIHGRTDDTPAPAYWHPAIDLGGRAMALQIEDLAALDMQQRYRWVDWFMTETDTYKFTNFLGILRFFENDPDLREVSGWASVADAGVLQAFQDGYRLYRGLEAVGYAFPNNTDPSHRVHAGSGWQRFFEMFHGRQSPQRSERQWGLAEQAGVNYGCRIAFPLYEQAPLLQRRKIYRLALWSDIYRGMKCRGWDQRWWGQRSLAPVMSADNWASEEFVRLIGERIITGGHKLYRRHGATPRFEWVPRVFELEIHILERLHARLAFDSEVVESYRPYGR